MNASHFVLLEAIITNSSLKAISVLGATCFAIVAATYKMIKDESFQTQNQFNVLRDETQRGFEKISNKLDRIDEQIHKYNERLANVEGQLDVLRNKK
mgnify:CR=1 FL=1